MFVHSTHASLQRLQLHQRGKCDHQSCHWRTLHLFLWYSCWFRIQSFLNLHVHKKPLVSFFHLISVPHSFSRVSVTDRWFTRIVSSRSNSPISRVTVPSESAFLLFVFNRVWLSKAMPHSNANSFVFESGILTAELLSSKALCFAKIFQFFWTVTLAQHYSQSILTMTMCRPKGSWSVWTSAGWCFEKCALALGTRQVMVIFRHPSSLSLFNAAKADWGSIEGITTTFSDWQFFASGCDASLIPSRLLSRTKGSQQSADSQHQLSLRRVKPQGLQDGIPRVLQGHCNTSEVLISIWTDLEFIYQVS